MWNQNTTGILDPWVLGLQRAEEAKEKLRKTCKAAIEGREVQQA
jgi:hypothetical protein